MAKYGPKAKEEVHKAMHEMKEGKLRSGLLDELTDHRFIAEPQRRWLVPAGLHHVQLFLVQFRDDDVGAAPSGLPAAAEPPLLAPGKGFLAQAFEVRQEQGDPVETKA